MGKSLPMKTIMEPSREIKVCRETDVVVVGGGPGGIGSAIAAARSGAETVLIERYGHLGGMATGGLVNIIPNLSGISGKQHLFGLNQELIDRLAARGGASYPKKEDWGTTDREVVDYYLNANLGWFYIRKDLNIKEGCRQLIETCARGGGYILAGAVHMDKGDPDNLRAMMEAAKEYGVYR